MNSCSFCGKPKNSLKTYSVKTGKLAVEGLNKQYMGQGIYKSTNLYSDVKWRKFHVCNACRWKWGLLYPTILASVISILFGIGIFVFGGESIRFGFTVFPGVLLGGHFIFFRMVETTKRKARRERGKGKYFILESEKS